jgi:hypothetical protein
MPRRQLQAFSGSFDFALEIKVARSILAALRSEAVTFLIFCK